MKTVGFMSSMCRFVVVKRWDFLAFGFSMGVLLLVYSLYQLPWGPAFYTIMVLSALKLFFTLGEGYFYWKKRCLLEKLFECTNAQAGVTPMLDAILHEGVHFNPLEQRYFSIIRLLESERSALADNYEQKSLAARNYYTLWSHQIKTPLAAAGLLLKEDKIDKNALIQQVFKIEQYVDMVLQFERLGDRDLEFKAVPIRHLVNQAVKRVSVLFIHKHIRLELGELDGDVLTDEKWLCFVLEQVLTNAVKYTRHGSVAIYWAEQGILAVKDTGTGIRAEDIPRLFSRGFTGYNGRADLEKRSTGIGLFLCKKTMDMLGHGIFLESTVGKGTTVFLDLRRGKLEVE